MGDAGQSPPAASRPGMPPEYGIRSPAEGSGLLPWAWAAERLGTSRGHWLATTRPDGRPHLMIVWGVWLDDALYFATSPRSRKGRNLASNPHAVISTARADEAAIVEGVVEEVSDPAAIQRFDDAYRTAYGEAIDTDLFRVHRLRPRVAFGFISTADRWAGSATRWEFP